MKTSSTGQLILCIVDADCSQVIDLSSPVFQNSKNNQSIVVSATQFFSFLDLLGAVPPPVLHLLDERLPDPPQAVAHLLQVTGNSAGLLSDLPQRLGPHDPLRCVPADDLSLGEGVGRDLCRPADRSRLRQLLDDLKVVDQIHQHPGEHFVNSRRSRPSISRQLNPALLNINDITEKADVW